MLKRIRQILVIINLKALLITALAILSTYICERFSLTAELPLTIIATAVVFPIVFSIGGAYKRREDALDEYGTIKAHGRAIYFAARDWLEDPSENVLSDARTLLGELLMYCRKLFMDPPAKMRDNEQDVYRQFSMVSRFIRNDLRRNGLASGEVSRCNQYLSKMLIAFESIKHVYQYRTPKTLRAFSDFFIVILPIIYGPHFAQMAKDATGNLHYAMPVLLSVILVSLDNIQEHLENPFDQIGEDDVRINAEKFIDTLAL
jgi:predicted membrane chloride channel (bestrophin family)